MKIGISTSCFYPLLTEKSLQKIGENNVHTTEIFFNALSELEPDFVKILKGIAREYDISVLSVHPTFSLAESFVYFSSYERRYREGLDTYKRYAEIVTELGGKYVVMHGGKPNKFLTNTEYFDRFGEMSLMLKREGATLLQENVVKFRAGSMETLRDMAEHLGEAAAFCLDIKQSFRGGYSPFDAMKLLGNRVKHLHISDNLLPEKDCLLPLCGNFDFGSFFETAQNVGYKGDAVIEVYSDCYRDEKELFLSHEKLSEKILKKV